MVAIAAPFVRLYQQAQQQAQIDPALVAAIARSETGDALANRGLFTLGIDARGTPGLPNDGTIAGPNGHVFYIYNSGLSAAQGLAAYLQTPIYGQQAVPLFKNAPDLLSLMIRKNYCVDEPGFPCGDWRGKILQLMAEVQGSPVVSAGPGPVEGPPSPSGSGSAAPPPAVEGCNFTPKDCASVSLKILGDKVDLSGPAQALCGIQNAMGQIGDFFCHLGTILHWFTVKGHWWQIGFVVAGVALIVAGLVIYVRPDSIGRVAASA